MAEKEAEKRKKASELEKDTSKITKDTLITEAMEKCPEALGIFFEHGLHCVGCGGAAFETIEQGCQVHGMSKEEIEKIVEEINEAVEKEKKPKE